MKHSEAIESDLLDNAPAASFIGTTPDTLKRSRRSGLLWGIPAPEFIKIGRRKIKYRRQTLQGWIDSLPTYNNTGEL